MLDWTMWDNRKRTSVSQNLGLLERSQPAWTLMVMNAPAAFISWKRWWGLSKPAPVRPSRQHWEISKKMRLYVESRSQHSTCACIVAFWAEVLLLPPPDPTELAMEDTEYQDPPKLFLLWLCTGSLQSPLVLPVTNQPSPNSVTFHWFAFGLRGISVLFVNTVSVA